MKPSEVVGGWAGVGLGASNTVGSSVAISGVSEHGETAESR